jgi:hypothetical protein
VAQTYFNKTYDWNESSEVAGLIVLDGDSIIIVSDSRKGMDTYLVFSKIDHLGDTLWTKQYGKVGEHYKIAKSGAFRRSKDNNLLFVGFHKLNGQNNNYLLMKLNTKADTLWTTKHGGTENNGAQSLCEAEDSTIWVSGFSQATGQNANIPVLQFSKTGALLWDTIYGGNGNDAIYSIETTLDGGFILGGESDSYGDGSDDIYVMKLNSKGVLEWDATFGNEKNDAGRALQISSGEYIVVGGVVPVGNSNSKGYMAKLDANGGLLWEKYYGYDDIYSDAIGHKTIELDNGDLIITGVTYDREGLNRPLGWLLKVNAQGDSLWSRVLRIRDRDHYLVDMKQTNDGGFILGGYVFSSSTGGDTQDLWVIKVDSMGCDVAHCVTGINNPLGASWGSVSVYPNPAFDYLTFDIDYSLYNNPEVMMYDSFGKLVLKQKLNNSVTTIDISLLQKGVYFYRFIADGEQLSTEKIVKL